MAGQSTLLYFAVCTSQVSYHPESDFHMDDVGDYRIVSALGVIERRRDQIRGETRLRLHTISMPLVDLVYMSALMVESDIDLYKII